MDTAPFTLPPPIDATPTLKPVAPPPGSPDALRQAGQMTDDEAQVPERDRGAVPLGSPKPLPKPVAVLSFANDERRVRRVPLEHPFDWNGVSYDSITLRRPVAAIYGEWDEDSLADLDDLYGAMAGLPGAVIRGLDPDDRHSVAERAYDFLPRRLRQAFESSLNAAGGDDTSETFPATT